jgi:hypothetical protein
MPAADEAAKQHTARHRSQEGHYAQPRSAVHGRAFRAPGPARRQYYFGSRLPPLRQPQDGLDLGYQDAAAIVGKTDVDLFGLEFGMRPGATIRIMETDRPLIGTIESRICPTAERTGP